ncbi:hypothetical protein KY304_02555 [Candidatus Woesearchaeota archaeon]|nr:hypothetical protein [Candidatus Woesearchaeota archaeon]MBW2978968.1 hypothetical protein [Candidatus Woesearchaeota archaeon]
MKRKKCEECNGKIIRKKVSFNLYGIDLGKFTADFCPKCNEEVYDEKTLDKINKIAKKKGLWGLESRTKVGEVGNSLDIRISKKIADFIGLRKGEDIIVHPESKKRIVIDVV